MPEPITAEQRAEWEEWLAERPPNVRAVAEAYPPWPTYRLTTTEQLAAIQKYDEHEDGTVTVTIFAWRDWLPFGHGVFGVDPKDLKRTDA